MNLKLAASDVLASNALIACEAASWRHAQSVLEAIRAGDIDTSGIRASLGGANRSTPARSPTRSLAVLELFGVLTPGDSIFTAFGAGTSLRKFAHELLMAGTDPAIKSIAVVCDSPGGLVTMTPETAGLMRTVRAKKPVTVAVAGQCCSGAYWITSNATSIEATPSARIGSIGVFGVRPSIVRQLDRAGIDVEVFSAGRFKTEGMEITAVTDEERRAKQEGVDLAYAEFVRDVAFGRGQHPSTVRAGFGEGRDLSAAEALRLHMIDRVDLVDSTVARVAAAPDVAAARAIAEQGELERALFALQLPSSAGAELTGQVKAQYEEERLKIEVVLSNFVSMREPTPCP